MYETTNGVIAEDWIVYGTDRRTKKRRVLRLFEREQDARDFCLECNYTLKDGYHVYDLEIEYEGDD